MNETKQQIIQKAISLYNENGFSQVTVRHIADALGRSPGNLTYHFKNSRALIDAIYNTMVAEMDSYYEKISGTSLATLYDLFQNLYHFQVKYKFFYFDFRSIAHSFPHLFNDFETTRLYREKQATRITEKLIKSGILKKSTGMFSYKYLFQSIWLLYPAAIQYEERANNKNTKLPIRLTWNMLIPHLTAKGRREFNEIISTKGDRSAYN